MSLDKEGLKVWNLYYNEFPVRLDFNEYLALLMKLREIEERYKMLRKAGIREDLEIEIRGIIVFILETDEAEEFLRELKYKSNQFVKDPKNALYILETLIKP